MKVVYVVVSNVNDTYYEQTLISAISLKKHTPSAQVYFLVDQDTAKTLTGKRTLHEKIGVNVVTVDVPADLPNMQRSRFIKTSMNLWVEGSFFYIDGDTVVCDTLDGMDESIDVGMVPDGNGKFEYCPTKKTSSRYKKKIGFSLENFDENYYNGGFMWYSDSKKAEQLLQLWHELWFKGYKKMPTDQPYLNEANKILKGAITEVSGVWNCQVLFDTPIWLPYIHEAKIIHYGSAKQVLYDLRDEKIQRSILKERHEKLDTILENPKSAFKTRVNQNTKLDIEFNMSAFHYNFRWCYENLHPLFCVCDFLSRCFFFAPKKLKRLVTGKQ